MPVVTKPECAKCAALPSFAEIDPLMTVEDGVNLRPAKPRPVVYGKTKPSRRCATHRREDRGVICVDCRPTDDGVKPPRPIDSRSDPDKPRCASHYRADRLARTTCVDCRALGDQAPDVRDIDPRSGPRKPQCTTHWRAGKKARKLKAHDTYVQKTYGLSEGEYWELYEAQGRKCAFPRCRATGKARRLAVDHDRNMAVNVCGHERDKGCRDCTRGLLCHGHNYELMGKYAGDLEDAIAYRDNPPARRLRREAA